MHDLELPEDAASLADAVMHAVRRGVASGHLDPSTTYSVYQLAARLGVSRSPVREALVRLADAGLVEIHRNRGFRVLLPTARDIEEIIDVRLALEPAAARRAATDGTAAAHHAIRDALDQLRAAARHDDEPAFWVADRALHDRVLTAAGNTRAARIVDDLRATTAFLGPPTTASGRTLAEILAEHEPVVAAVLARDGATAQAEMRAHLRSTGRLLALHLPQPR